MSFIEAATNVVVGLLVSFGLQITLYGCMNIPVTTKQNLFITAAFFVASFLRSFVLRRIFNKLHGK